MIEAIKQNKLKWLVIAVLVFAAVIFFVWPDMSHAADVPDSTSDIKSQDLDSTVGGLIRKIVNFAAIIAGVIFVGFLIRDGIKLAGSSGNPQTRSEAVRGIIYSLLGCLCAVGASIFVGVVIGML